MTKFFKKCKKPYFGVIWGNFSPSLGENEFSWKKGLCQFLNIPIIYHGAKILKILQLISDKNAELLMDRQTENSDFIGPSLGQGSKKSNLEHSTTLSEREKILIN